jgi:hypothetical protein
MAERTVMARSRRQPCEQSVDRHRALRLLRPNHMSYEATLDDPQTFTRPWTIEMPLYRLVDQQAQLLEHKCVPFADGLLYHDLLRKDDTKERR